MKNAYEDKLATREEALKCIRSGDRILGTMMGSIPTYLFDGLYEEKERLENVVIYQNSHLEDLKIFSPECNGHIDVETMFLMGNERKAIANGRKLRVEIAQLNNYYRKKIFNCKPNVAILMATPPDENGNMSLGPAPGDAADMVPFLDRVIVQVNRELPYISGKNILVNVKDVDYIVEHDAPMGEMVFPAPTDKERKMAAYIAELVPDGACLQLGIGGVPAAVGGFLKDKKHLGIHTELFSDTMMELMECGAVDNSQKDTYPGISVMGSCAGTGKLYRYLDHNPLVEHIAFSEGNNPYVIAKNKNMVSVNGAIACDITGQICAETLGFKHYSGSGGHLDYARGAQLSDGGKSFIAFPSTLTKRDGSIVSKIALTLPLGSAVTTPRTEVQYVVTEYGAVNIQNETIENRVKLLVSIAHPDFRDKLMFDAKKAGLII